MSAKIIPFPRPQKANISPFSGLKPANSTLTPLFEDIDAELRQVVKEMRALQHDYARTLNLDTGLKMAMIEQKVDKMIGGLR